MPTIIDAVPDTAGVYSVTVRPDGDRATSGKLLTATNQAGTGTKTEVGTWAADTLQDGKGEARTPAGVWLFAQQKDTGAISDGVPLVQIVDQ